MIGSLGPLQQQFHHTAMPIDINIVGNGPIQIAGSPNKEISGISQNNSRDLASMQSSGNESGHSATFQKFLKIQSKTTLPTSLKVIFQIISLLAVLIVIASVIDLSFSLENIQKAYDILDVNELSLSRINDLRMLRVVMRSLVNIANDLQEVSSQVISDRFNYMLSIAGYLYQSLKIESVKINQKQINFAENNSQVGILTSKNQIEYQWNKIQIITEMYLNKVSGLLDDLNNSKSLNQLKSNNNLIALQEQNKIRPNSSSILERDLFFILYNQNHDIYEGIERFTSIYTDETSRSIDENTDHSSILNISCFSLIILSGILIIPLTIQLLRRMDKLVHFFYNLDKVTVFQRLDNIKQFQDKILQQLNSKQSNSGKIQLASVMDMDDNTTTIQNIGMAQEFSNTRQTSGYTHSIQSSKRELNLMKGIKRSKRNKFSEDSDDINRLQKLKSRKKNTIVKMISEEEIEEDDSFAESQRQPKNDKNKEKINQQNQDQNISNKQTSLAELNFNRGNQKKKFSHVLTIFNRKTQVDLATISLLEAYTYNSTIMINKFKDKQLEYNLKSIQQSENQYSLVVQENSLKHIPEITDYAFQINRHYSLTTKMAHKEIINTQNKISRTIQKRDADFKQDIILD
ncbi:UNKNOWN [Stylonychia lemnae]|uniref:Transmembrane protein n=1 Tax=Stylonychia lemnae TaxID=5949 RepID=A0A078A771_STYLE|nr:UNKNOWN [Stylonychia lemnae]|eukprot:CDW77731.1 UNKNOWN [Stylonychia lemnae]